jgi:hypothetical protein
MADYGTAVGTVAAPGPDAMTTAGSLRRVDDDALVVLGARSMLWPNSVRATLASLRRSMVGCLESIN